MCRVSGCNENHTRHYCKICRNDDVSHFAKDCPEGVVLWHGTRITSLSSISLNNGLTASGPDCRLGQGVYFAGKDDATAVSKHRGNGTGVVVIGCRVRLGNMKNCGYAADKNWHGQYDSACGIHPSWAGLPAFTEYCLGDESRHRIKEVHIIGGVVNGEVRLPGVDIRIQGNVTFNCNVTAGNLLIG